MLSKLARHRNVAHLSLSPSPYYHGSIPKDFFVGNPFSVKEPKGSVSVASPVLDSEIERKAVFAGNEVAQKQAVQAKIILERNLKAEEMALAGPELAQKTVHEIYNKPILFKDAVGRKFSFPFHSCAQWEVCPMIIVVIAATNSFEGNGEIDQTSFLTRRYHWTSCSERTL